MQQLPLLSVIVTISPQMYCLSLSQ